MSEFLTGVFLYFVIGIFAFIGFICTCLFLVTVSVNNRFESSNNKNFAEKLEDYKKGSVHLVCEHKGCFSQDVQEYERKEDGRDWEGEPIALCKKHSEGFTHYSKKI